MKFTTAVSLFAVTGSVAAAGIVASAPAYLTLTAVTAGKELDNYNPKLMIDYTGEVFLQVKSLRDPDDQPTYFQNYNGIGYYNHVFGTMLYLTAYLDKSAPLNFETKERCPLSTRAISEFGSITVDSNLTYRYGDNFQSKWKACLDGNGWGVPARYIPVWDSMDSIKVNQPGDLKKCIKIDVKVTAATGSRQVII